MMRAKDILACIVFLMMITTVCAQSTENGKGDTLAGRADFDYKAYYTFEKKQCDAEAYSELKEIKDLLCKASYLYTNGENRHSLELLKQAFQQGYSVEFKMKVIGLMIDNYNKLGLTDMAKIYQDQLDKIRDMFYKTEGTNSDN